MPHKGSHTDRSGDKDPLKVDPTSLTFDVKAYIRHAYADATHLDMVQTLKDAVRREADATGEDLKTLIRESMGTFIGYKETMDTMHANDKPLFTGEALDPITDAFQSALEDGEALIAPTLELFEDLRATKLKKETLAKFMAVWSVPGLIYEHCGVRIASRLSDGTRLYGSFGAPPEGESKQEVSSADSDDSESDGTDSDSRDNDGGRNDVKKGNAKANAAELLARGALEFAVGGDDDDDFVLKPGEELRYWYGTAIAQLRNPIARRRAIDARSNYEAAVLSLRRAMLYLEENYDLEHAVVLGEGESNAAELLPHGAGGDEESPAEEKPELAMTLTCQYAMALLRAALYLNKQLSYELRQANAADTVLIEDTLSAMMDVSIATVKLRHFCWAARAMQRPDEAAAGVNALSRLRHHSDVSTDDDEDDDEDENNNNKKDSNRDEEDDMRSGQSDADGAALSESNGRAETVSSMKMSPMANRSFAAMTATGADAAAPSTGPRCRAEHPVEFYVRITRNQHTRLMEASARRARRDALNWRQKFMPCARPASVSARAASAAGHQGTALLPDGSFTAAGAGAGGALLGNFADSFVPSKASHAGMEAVSETTVGETITERIRVNLLDTPDCDSSHLLADADAILEAFRTPEANFGKFTTFRIGEEDMGVVLECSAAQLVMQSRGILHQIAERADVEVDVAVHAAAVHTFASRLFEACLEHMELVLASYWGGIATAIHAGVFDFNSDASTPLGRMLHGPAALADGTGEALRSQRSMYASSINNSSTSAVDSNSPSMSLNNHTGANDADRKDSGLPPLVFVPVVARNTSGLTLRQLSVAAVRRGVRAAGDILHALLLASANREVVQAFVRTMAAYREEDLSRSDDGCGRGEGEGEDDEMGGERVELHAAILVELLLAQWERAMTQVNQTVLRMKIVVGESCTSASMSSDAQAQEVGELLEELEQLRSTLLRCYTHAVGLLAKAYVTLLPSLQPPVSVQTAGVTEEKRSVASVRARISREFVSSVMTNKLLNLLSVVVDRTAPFLQRYDEIFNGIDLFAAKAEGRDEVPSTSQRNSARRTRLLRRQQLKESSRQQQRQQEEHQHQHQMEQQMEQEQQQGNAEVLQLPGGGQLDPVTAFMAQCNSRMALDHTAEHEEVILALVANILLVFVDMLHCRCQCASSATDASGEARERAIVESLADALCLPTSVAPIVANELIAPCVLSVVAALAAPDSPRAWDTSDALERKLEHFRADYLARVEEHCQLVVDAMLRMFLCAPQQLLTREVRSAGFIMPMFDWQRVSAHTAGAVRPYVTDALVHIARAHESLQLLRQPLFGAAVTQRLVAHFAFAFLTAFTADGNAFEISPDCSVAFRTHGLILIEAEARTILGIVDALANGVAQSPKAGDVLPELRAAREALAAAAAALRAYGGAMCDSIATRGAHGVGDDTMAVKQREGQCDAMVAAAMKRSRYLVQAIITYAEDSTVAAAFRPAASGAVPERLAERLARREEGYRLAHMARRTDTNGEEGGKGEKGEKAEEEDKSNAKRRRRVALRKRAQSQADGAKAKDDDGDVGALSLRTANRVSVLRIAAELAARAAVEETKESAKERDGDGDGEKDSTPRHNAKARTRRTVRKGHTAQEERTGDNAAQTRRFKRNLAL